MQSGIYIIINKINNKVYIGQSKNLEKRKQQHFKKLKQNKHHNDHLQKAYNKYGENNFLFKELMFCDINLDEMEKFFIKIFNSANREKGYNILEFANENPVNKKEIRKKISESQTGKKHSKEWKEKASFWNTGERNAMYGKSGTWLGKKFSKSHKENIRKALRKDLPSSKELYNQWKKGYTLKELGQKYGCSQSCISDRIKEGGYSFNKHNKGKRKHDWIKKASVQKSGFDGYNKKQRYQLVYDTKVIKQSIDKKILDKMAKQINQGQSPQQVLNNFKTLKNTPYIRKKKHSKVKQGFIWIYTYWENNKRKEISSVDLSKLKNKVEKMGYKWIDEDDISV